MDGFGKNNESNTIGDEACYKKMMTSMKTRKKTDRHIIKKIQRYIRKKKVI